MEVRISVFSRAAGRSVRWTTVGIGPFTSTVSGSSTSKARQRLMDGLRKKVATLLPYELAPLEAVRGRKLEQVVLDLSIRAPQGRKRFHAKVPLVIEPRTRGSAAEGALQLVYHPLRPESWFVHEPGRTLAEEAKAYFQR